MSIEKVSYDYAYNELIYNNDILESIIEMHVDENNINQSGGAKKCSIEKSDKIFFGNGGSSSIIVITRSKKVFKMMTHYFWSDMIEYEINNRNKI